VLTVSKSITRALVFYNGYFENFGEAIVRHLQSHGHVVTVIQAPLLTTDSKRMRRKVGQHSETRRERKSLFRAPASFILDPIHLLRVGRSHVDVTLSCHVMPILLLRRALGLTSKIVYWSVDYSPQRFRHSFLETTYRMLERWSIRFSDIQVDISEKARVARFNRHDLTPQQSSYVIPSGVWTNRLITPSQHRHSLREVALIGVLEPHVGGMIAVQAIAALKELGIEIKLHVFGEGPDRGPMEKFAQLNGIADLVMFYNFNISIPERNLILEQCMLGLAPYIDDPLSISLYGDPGKVKDYAAASLPTVITHVPPVGELISSLGIGCVVSDNSESITGAIKYFVDNWDEWWIASNNSFDFAKSCEWTKLLSRIPF
jgi:glycosyltransferase involved in cell wall biosynthesis